jgi:hypothetical protein
MVLAALPMAGWVAVADLRRKLIDGDTEAVFTDCVEVANREGVRG